MVKGHVYFFTMFLLILPFNLPYLRKNLVPIDMADQPTCVVCTQEFEKKKKGYKRRAINSKLTSPRTFGRVFKKSTPDRYYTKGHFICNSCCNQLKENTTTKGKSNKRTWIGDSSSAVGTPLRKRQALELPTSPHANHTNVRSKVNEATNAKKLDFSEERITPLQKAIKYLESSKYELGFRALVHNSASAKKALMSVTCEIIKQEVSLLIERQINPIIA